MKTRRQARIVFAIVVAWYANISEMPGMAAAALATDDPFAVIFCIPHKSRNQ